MTDIISTLTDIRDIGDISADILDILNLEYDDSKVVKPLQLHPLFGPDMPEQVGLGNSSPNLE